MQRRRHRVAIIGAGLAGLSAAWRLHRRGFATVVLEARGRVGGRVCTIRSPFRDQQIAEAGAARFASDHTTTLRYIRALGLRLRSFYPSEGRLVLSGKNGRHEIDGHLPSHQCHDLLTGGDVTAPRPSVRDRLTRHLPWPLAPRRWYEIIGGADRLPNALGARLPNVLLKTTVLGVDQQDAHVIVHYASSPHHTATVRADYVVCTAPLSVFDRFEFTPDISPTKRECMSRVNYRSACRCFFQVAERFWDARGCNGFGRSDMIGEVWHATFNQAGGRGVLVAYCQGTQAETMATLSEDARIERTTRLLERVHPGISEAVETAVAYHWNDDAWARGAQSVAWDLKDAELRELARPEGRVYFAGEHTAPRRWLGWVNGALLSGERVAREIQRRSASE